MAKDSLTPKGKEILGSFIKAARKTGKYPTRAEMLTMGHSRDSIRQQFSSLQKLKEYARKSSPEFFENLLTERLATKEQKADSRKAIGKYKRFVVTTAVDGMPAHLGMLESLKSYSKKNQALLVIIPSGTSYEAMDPALADLTWIFEDTYLNSNILISSIKVPPKSANPLTSLARLGQRNGSTIVASPKQFLEFCPVGDNKMPHALMSTGAVTRPTYASKGGKVLRTDFIAQHDHVYGAVVVEIEDDKYYHFRQLQAESKSGAVVDLGIRYEGNKISKYAPEAFVIGDYHVTETDPTAARAWDEVQKLTGVRTRVHHDVFSGVSINHHEEESMIVRALLAQENKLSLEAELRALARALDEETLKCDEVVVVDSNHHDFLTKHYLQKGKYVSEPFNFKIAHKLVAAVMEGKDPLRYAMEELIGLKRPEKIRWLKRDESYRVAGIELGAHGDKGANGSKGSPMTLEKAYGNCVVGHSHTPKVIRGFWQVGTSTHLKLPYTVGGSSWCHTSCLVYPNGSRQLINSIGGKWRRK